MKNHTWDLVPPSPTQIVVHNKWIFYIKYKEDGSLDKYKARLVAKGFKQIPRIDFSETFSHVIKPSTICIIFTLVVINNSDICQVDINNSFHNGDLKEAVYIHQLEGFEDPFHPTYVCRLRKALYGFHQALRSWFDKLFHALLQCGFNNSLVDSSLFFMDKNGNLLLLLVYVDDILIIGDFSVDIHHLVTDLHHHFALKDLGLVHYFFGFEVYRQ